MPGEIGRESRQDECRVSLSEDQTGTSAAASDRFTVNSSVTQSGEDDSGDVAVSCFVGSDKVRNSPSNLASVVRPLIPGQHNDRLHTEHTRLTSRDPSPDADETAAFMALLMQHRHRLYAFIAKQLVNPADVEDVFQKSSIVLWKKMSEFGSDGSFFHWACGIAFNEVRNFLTVQRRSRLQFDLELIELLAQEAVEEESLSESRLDALRRCLKQLPDRQQSILRQCYNGTESITTVAEQLGRERTALYKQLARLREKLLDCINLRLAEGTSS